MGKSIDEYPDNDHLTLWQRGERDGHVVDKYDDDHVVSVAAFRYDDRSSVPPKTSLINAPKFVSATFAEQLLRAIFAFDFDAKWAALQSGEPVHSHFNEYQISKGAKKK